LVPVLRDAPPAVSQGSRLNISGLAPVHDYLRGIMIAATTGFPNWTNGVSAPPQRDTRASGARPTAFLNADTGSLSPLSSGSTDGS